MVVVGRVSGAAEVSVFEPVEVTVEGGDFGVVDQPIDHRSGDTSSPNTSPQRPKGFVGGDDQAGALIPGRDELEEVHLGCFRYLSHYSQLTATDWLDFALSRLVDLRPVHTGCNRGAP
jgi:hypothetical protein